MYKLKIPVKFFKFHLQGYPQLYDTNEFVFLRYVYRRVRDGWERPIASVAGTEILLKDRITKNYGWTFE